MQKILLTVFVNFIALIAYGQLTFTVVAPPVTCETNDFCVDVDVTDFDRVTGLEYAMLWDTSEFDYVSHTFFLSSIPTDIVDQDKGYMAFSWFGPFTGLTLPDDSTIIQLCLTRKANAGTAATVELGEQPGQGISISDIPNGLLVENVTFFFNDATITITDDEDPMISCPADITVMDAMPGGLAPLTLSDNCGIEQVTYTLGGATTGAGFTDASPTSFVEGITTVSYLAQDFGGRTAGCMFDVTYIDNSPLDPDILYFDPLITLDCATDIVTVEFRVINFDSLSGMQMGINWDPSIITYRSHTNLALNPPSDPFNTNITNAGTLGLLWSQTPSTPDGLSLANSTVIFSIEFDLVTTLGLPLFTYGNFGPLLFEINRFDNTRLDPSQYEFLPGSIEVADTDAPVFAACPADVTLSASNAACGTSYFWIEPTASDNCDNMLDITQTHNPGDFFDIGIDTVIYIVTDDAGLMDTCSFMVTVEDNSDPVLSCPANQIVDNEMGACSAMVNGLGLTVLSNCPSRTTFSMSGATTGTGANDISGTTFNVGETIVTYTATESSGRMATCSFSVTVNDVEVPTITCPSNISQDVDMGTCTAAVTVPAPTTADNCSVASVTNDFNNTADASGTYPIGTTVVIWTVTDASNLTATCSMEVTVTDNEAPSITCPADLTVDITSGTSSVVNGIDPVVNDLCGAATTTYRIGMASGNNTASGQTFNIGTTAVTYIAEDANGNKDSCTFNVTVRFTQNDILDCPAPVNTTTDPGVCSAAVNGIAPIINIDMADIASITFSTTDGRTGVNDAAGNFPLGTTTVEYIANDRFGNADTCSFAVTVTDDENPSFSGCPMDINMDANASCMATVNWTAPTPSDNCMIDRTTSSHNPGDNFGIGTTVVTYTTFDAANNSAVCTFNVIVTDNALPTWSACPGDINLDADASCMAIANWTIPTASDNCGIDRTTSSHAPGASFGIGTTIVTYIAFDDAGNSAVCSFNVIVTDNELPTWSNCPGDITLDGDANCMAIANWTIPTASDNCGIDRTTSSHAPGASFGIGTTIVTYIAFDDAGNSAVCSFNVIVTDNELPTWSNCPGDITLDGDANCMAVANWTIPTASDNCGIDRTTSTHMSGSTFGPGTTMVTYTAFDAAGNSAVCTFNVTVRDAVDPTFVSCAATNLSLTYLPDCRAIATWDAVTATDNCGTATVTCTHSPGDTLDEGITRVVCLAVDLAGNTVRCEFDIEVLDTTDPVSTFCPPNKQVAVDPGLCTTVVDWQQPVFTDNCSSPTLSSNFPSGFAFPLGVSTVIYTATDDSGNTATCTFDITVIDDEAPQLVCDSIVVRIDGTIISDPGNIVLTATPDNSCAGVKLSYREPIGADNCDGNIVATKTSTGPGNGDTFMEGETLITYEVADNSTNSNSCTIKVIVQPLSMIAIQFVPGSTVCEGTDVSMTINNSNPALTYSWSGPDNFSSTLAEPSLTEVTTLNAGQYCVTITTPSLCEATSCTNLTVNAGPIFTASSNSPVCQDNLELIASLDPASVTVSNWTWTYPNGTNDNSQNPVIPNPDVSFSGTYSVVAEGSNGCSSSQEITVEIGNIPPPEISSDCDPTICLGTSCNLIGTEYLITPDVYNWVAEPAENAGLPTNTNNNEIEIIPTAAGTYTYRYWVSKGNCTSDTATFTIQVFDNPVANDDNLTTNFETTLSNFDVKLNDAFSTSGSIGATISVLGSPTNGTLQEQGDGIYSYTPDNGYLGMDRFIYQICYTCRGQLICDEAFVNINVVFNGPCEVPTVISPNGDQFNDELIINCLDSGNFPESELIIFNGWGDEVFRQQPYQNNWRGTWKDKDLPDGIYYYLFKADPSTTLQKGTINILR